MLRYSVRVEGVGDDRQLARILNRMNGYANHAGVGVTDAEGGAALIAGECDFPAHDPRARRAVLVGELLRDVEAAVYDDLGAGGMLVSDVRVQLGTDWPDGGDGETIRNGALIEVCEGPLLGVKGEVVGFTPGGRAVVRPSQGVVPPDLLSGRGTVAVVPCHCSRWDGVS